MNRKIVLPALLVFLVIASGCIALSQTGTETPEQFCTESGGTIETQLCCLSSGDFPNTCLIGACGCSPENSHNVSVCSCGDGKCFDGTRCVAQE